MNEEEEVALLWHHSSWHAGWMRLLTRGRSDSNHIPLKRSVQAKQE